MDQEKTSAEPVKAQVKAKLTPVFSMLEESCKVYAQNIKKFIEIYLRGLVGLIPFLAILVLFLLLLAMGVKNSFVNLLLAVLGFLALLWAVYYGILVRAAMILLIKSNYSSAKENFTQSKGYFWGYVWVSIVVSVIIGLWTLLLIIPGIIFAVYFMLVNYTFFFEDFKGYMALKRSKELVKGYWWDVCGRTLFIGLIAVIVNIILSAPLAALEAGSPGYIIYNSFMNLIWALIAPIIIIYTYYIFRDLKNIKGESKLSVIKK